jgi:hypothetical protein
LTAATTAAVASFSNKNQRCLKKSPEIKNHSLNKRERRSSPQKMLPNFPFQITPVVSRFRGSEVGPLL